MAELNKQASTREAPATSVVVAPPPKLTAPPRVKEQTEIDSKVAEVSQASAAAAVAAFYLLLHHLLLATITRHHHLHPTATFATTSPHLLHLHLPQMHAATVIQKSQRAASKKALTTELKGQLYKRSNMTPRFQRRWFYVVGDAAGCAAAQFCAILRNYSDATRSSSGTTRCATASATSTARAAARRSESPSRRSRPSRSTTRCGTPRAILAPFWRHSGAILAQFLARFWRNSGAIL